MQFLFSSLIYRNLIQNACVLPYLLFSPGLCKAQVGTGEVAILNKATANTLAQNVSVICRWCYYLLVWKPCKSRIIYHLLRIFRHILQGEGAPNEHSVTTEGLIAIKTFWNESVQNIRGQIGGKLCMNTY